MNLEEEQIAHLFRMRNITGQQPAPRSQTKEEYGHQLKNDTVAEIYALHHQPPVHQNVLQTIVADILPAILHRVHRTSEPKANDGDKQQGKAETQSNTPPVLSRRLRGAASRHGNSDI